MKEGNKRLKKAIGYFRYTLYLGVIVNIVKGFLFGDYFRYNDFQNEEILFSIVFAIAYFYLIVKNMKESMFDIVKEKYGVEKTEIEEGEGYTLNGDFVRLYMYQFLMGIYIFFSTNAITALLISSAIIFFSEKSYAKLKDEELDEIIEKNKR